MYPQTGLHTNHMNDEQYLQHCTEQFQKFADELAQRTQSLDEAEPLRELARAFQGLQQPNVDLYSEAETLVCRLFTTYPDFSPTFPRELLWFLGGDCLHFMPDEEIAIYQQLEAQREETATRGEVIDFAAARAKLLNLQ